MIGKSVLYDTTNLVWRRNWKEHKHSELLKGASSQSVCFMQCSASGLINDINRVIMKWCAAPCNDKLPTGRG